MNSSIDPISMQLQFDEDEEHIDMGHESDGNDAESHNHQRLSQRRSNNSVQQGSHPTDWRGFNTSFHDEETLVDCSHTMNRQNEIQSQIPSLDPVETQKKISDLTIQINDKLQSLQQVLQETRSFYEVMETRLVGHNDHVIECCETLDKNRTSLVSKMDFLRNIAF